MKKIYPTSIIALLIFLCEQPVAVAQKASTPSKKESNVATKKADNNQALLEINKGKQAFSYKDFTQSFQLLHKNKNAVQMDAEALYNLAYMYENGLGVSKNINEAIVYYKKSADKGDFIAGFAFERLKYGLLNPSGKKDDRNNAINLMYSEINKGKQAFSYKDFTQSFQLLHKNKNAVQIDAEALYNLAYMYENGLGVSKNINEAIAYYKKAADKGNVAAKIAFKQLKDEVVNVSTKKEVPRSNIESINNEIKQGKQAFLAQNFTQSFELLHKNKDTNQMDTEALYDLATMYENGLGVSKNIIEAIVCYKKAADKGNTLAKIALQRLNNDFLSASNEKDIPYKNIGLGSPEIRQGKEAFLNKDFNQSFQLLYKNKDNEQMDGEALFDLAHMYEYGLGVSKNLNTALFYYKKAAYNGDNLAKIGIQRVNNDLLSAKNEKEAPKNNVDLVSLEIKQGKEAFFLNEFERGFNLLYKNKDAQQMDGEAFLELGYMYENGLGVNLNTNTAISFYKKAIDKGNDIAKYAFQRLNAPKVNEEINQAKKAASATNYTLAFQLLHKNEEFIAFDSDALFLLGYMYETGKGVTKDHTQAARWYRKAAVKGNAGAQNNLGLMFETGQGVEKDIAQAVYWYNKAAVQGLAKAQNNLGFMYETGQGVEKNEKQAVMWYHKAAKQGDARAQNNLGVMHKYGRGVEKDEKRAVMWYGMAAEKGDVLGQLNLGIMYETGRGVKRDIKQAAIWYIKAAEQGDALAQSSLGFMYENGRGVEKDVIKAIELYQKAARQGSADAQQNLKRLNKTW